MKKLHPILASYIPVTEGLAHTFGEHCEVVLHDLTDLSSSIVAIHNSHVSGRDSGAPMTNLGLKILRHGKAGKDLMLNYQNKGIKDKVIKSSSMLIRDEDDNVIGCLCINMDITHIQMMENILKHLTNMDQDEGREEESFSPSIADLMNQMIKECANRMGKPIPLLSKEEKINFVALLDQMGLFLVKGAVQHVADLLDVSKFTIYNYIEKKGKEITN
jgi:predicted transcriptional regulator YheO